jgi:hypothetical protein
MRQDNDYGAAVDTWPEPVERVAAVLRAAAVDARVEEFADETPTAGAAARAAGCKRAEIVKSLVFVCDQRPVLALVPGDKRVDAARLSAAAGAERRPRPDGQKPSPARGRVDRRRQRPAHGGARAR